MNRLFLTLALLAVVLSAPNVMAGGGSYQAFLDQWRAVQAEQKRNDAALNKIDRDAASWGIEAGAGGQTVPQQPVSPKKKAWSKP
jgi:hypothetical protein